MTPMTRNTAILFGIIVNFIWGLAFLVPHLLHNVNPVMLAFGRYLFYGFISLILIRSASQTLSKFTLADWGMAMTFAFAGNVGYYVFLAIAIHFSGVPITALIVGTLPITIAIYGNFVEREFPFRILALPVGLILIGLVTINGYNYINPSSPEKNINFISGILFAFTSLLLWTWYGVRSAQYMKRNKHISGNSLSIAIGLCSLLLSIIGMILILIIDSKIYAINLQIATDFQLLISFLLGSALLGIVVSWFATLLWNQVIRELPISLSGQLIVFETLSGIIYASIADAVVPSTIEIVCSIIIISGVLIGVRITTSANQRAINNHAVGEKVVS